jgi:hypothetical protein
MDREPSRDSARCGRHAGQATPTRRSPNVEVQAWERASSVTYSGRVHFDDPAAETCRTTVTDDEWIAIRTGDGSRCQHWRSMAAERSS